MRETLFSYITQCYNYKKSLKVLKIVIKVIQVIGSSDKSWEDAAKNAVETASKTVKGITGVDVINLTATVKDGKVAKYKATCKLAFMVKE